MSINALFLQMAAANKLLVTVLIVTSGLGLSEFADRFISSGLGNQNGAWLGHTTTQ